MHPSARDKTSSRLQLTPPPTRRSGWVLWLMLGLILIGTALRWSTLESQPLWLDEFVTLDLSTDEGGIVRIWSTVAERIHPPLHLLLTRSILTLLPENEFGLRWLSATSGVLALALMARYLLDVVGPVPAVLGTSVLTFSPFHLHYSQEARAYAFSMTVLLFAALMFRRQLARGKWVGWLLHTLCLIVLAYSHYFNLFILGAEILYFAIHMVRKSPPRETRLGFAISVLLVVTALLPLIPPFLQAFQGQRVLSWTSRQMTPISAVKTLATGESRYVPSIWRSVGGAALMILVGAGLRRSVSHNLFDLITISVPVLFLFVVLRALGHTVPPYEERQLLVILPFAIALASAGIEVLFRTQQTWTKGLAMATAAVMLVAAWGGVYHYNNRYLKNRDFAVVTYLDEVAHPDDLVVLNTYSAEVTFAFYGPDQLVYWGKPERNQGDWVFSTEIGMAFDEEVTREKSWDELMSRSRVWLIYLPGQGPAALTEELLAKRPVLERQRVGPFRVYLLGERDR